MHFFFFLHNCSLNYCFIVSVFIKQIFEQVALDVFQLLGEKMVCIMFTWEFPRIQKPTILTVPREYAFVFYKLRANSSC